MMTFEELENRYTGRIKRICVDKYGHALVVFSDGSAGVWPTPESLEDFMESKSYCMEDEHND